MRVLFLLALIFGGVGVLLIGLLSVLRELWTMSHFQPPSRATDKRQQTEEPE